MRFSFWIYILKRMLPTFLAFYRFWHFVLSIVCSQNQEMQRSVFKTEGGFFSIENIILLLQTQCMYIIESLKNTNKQKDKAIKTQFLLSRDDSCLLFIAYPFKSPSNYASVYFCPLCCSVTKLCLILQNEIIPFILLTFKNKDLYLPMCNKCTFILSNIQFTFIFPQLFKGT